MIGSGRRSPKIRDTSRTANRLATCVQSLGFARCSSPRSIAQSACTGRKLQPPEARSQETHIGDPTAYAARPIGCDPGHEMKRISYSACILFQSIAAAEHAGIIIQNDSCVVGLSAIPEGTANDASFSIGSLLRAVKWTPAAGPLRWVSVKLPRSAISRISASRQI
jgi:hypothetical protein